ncbi:cbb3-type cytochrome oxidase assembly protein CcoS [Dokdonella sp.]|uniref:cbb3-type cytochrome oxidase assembly protein CcoS n=1 Tax=Dokdonella sp. TaxID=2291710 RepID=UPI001B01C9C1|nr:cbb3-type cytochrome oxidase assembly protein CcoS [Dokdonella sp.]MBO9663016.1 cbb3-type cytochrome oxidase assembly protein CcoS [Dokdonella sp.]
MNILLALIPVSILLLIAAGIAFFWAVDHDQFDDMDTPALLPLLDDPGVGGSPEPAAVSGRAGAPAASDDAARGESRDATA